MKMWKFSYTGNVLSSTGPPSLTRRSCNTCQGQKRQCDRLLPQCTRCRRRGNSCHYEGLYLDEESRHKQRYCFVNAQPHFLNIASPAQSTLPSQKGASNIAVSPMWLGSGSMEQQVINEVLSVLFSSSTSLREIVEKSRKSVLSWLPIIHIPELAWKTDQLQQEPSADVAILLLAVHLMNELFTPPALQHDRNSAPLLEFCRILFLNLFQKRTASLETVQAGIILSALQLDAGQLNDASLTIAMCANLGIRLSLNHLPVVGTGFPSRLGIMKRNIWYAIILLDRIISVADPSSSAAVVVTDESLERQFAQNLSRDTSVPSDYEETYDNFISQTRAAYILGKVCSFVRTQPICCSSCLEAKFWDLDYTLRMMGIAAVKKSSGGGGNLPCVASPLIFIAMAVLYQFKLEYDVQCKEGQNLTCTPAYLALVSVTSMVHDIARARLPQTGSVTFPGIISLYHVAKATLSLHHLCLDSGIVVNDIIDTLRSLTQRSKLAGVYLERL